MTFFTGTRRHRVQIAHFFRGQIGSRARSGIGLGSGSRLRRMHPYLELPRELWIQNFGKSWASEMPGYPIRELPYISTDGSGCACGVGDCPMSSTTLGGLGDTSGPRIDRIPPTRPPGSVPLISLDHKRTDGYSRGCIRFRKKLVSYRR